MFLHEIVVYIIFSLIGFEKYLTEEKFTILLKLVLFKKIKQIDIEFEANWHCFDAKDIIVNDSQ